ncbi:hypothetical protein [Pacificibacter marinus]|nr:hypothetical protein [Pacificibacter marinus]MBU2868677.1 hypothetical protein [Pacificibacter marinus]
MSIHPRSATAALGWELPLDAIHTNGGFGPVVPMELELRRLRKIIE